VVTDCYAGNNPVHNHRPAFGGNRRHLRNFCDIPANDSLKKTIGFIAQFSAKGDF
jgi:hypothetical protein